MQRRESDEYATYDHAYLRPKSWLCIFWCGACATFPCPY